MEGRKKISKALLISAFVLSLILIQSVLVSPTYATPTETNVSPSATHFPQNKQNESPMAVNPTDPSNVITGANDEINEPDCTPPTGGSSSCPFAPKVSDTGVYWTTDGGTTWNHQILDWFALYGFRSDGDPVVAFGPMPTSSGGFSSSGARAYFGTLVGSPLFGPSEELIAVTHSDDGGANWSPPVIATTRTNPVDFNDKIAIWADSNPSSPNFGNVYVSWTLFIGVGVFGIAPVFSPEPIMFARSTDGGSTFSAPVQLTQASNNGIVGGRQGSTIRSGPEGNVYVFWDGAISHQSAILGARSLDGGVHFSRPFLVTFKSDVPSPFPGASFRTNSFPTADVDQTSGKIFVAWADYDFSTGHGVVKMATSSNAGKIWSSPQPVADVSDRSAFYPAIAVSHAGSTTKVFVGFNAIDDKPAGTAPGAGVVSYDAYDVISTDGGTTFSSPPTKISASPSDPDASSTNSLRHQFLGDYNGAAASSSKVWFSWTDSRNGVTCSDVDSFRAGGSKPNIYDSCSTSFGNTDIFVADVSW